MSQGGEMDGIAALALAQSQDGAWGDARRHVPQEIIGFGAVGQLGTGVALVPEFASHQAPPSAMSSSRMLKPALLPYQRRSLPRAAMRVRKSRRLPAKVSLSTGSASTPLRMRMPLAPTLRSPLTGSTVWRPMISVMSTPFPASR